jgi:uncharacterized protein (TIGR03086 family)
MTVFENYLRAVDGFDRAVAEVPADRWDTDSACTEWTNRDVLGHVTWGQHLVRHLATGVPYASRTGAPGAREPGVLVPGADPIPTWRAAREACVAALVPERRARIVELRPPFGTLPLEGFLEALTVDFLAHTWDIGSRVGVPVRFDTDLVEAGYGWSVERLSGPRAPGGFADPVEPAPGADGQERLLAFLGRNVLSASRG